MKNTIISMLVGALIFAGGFFAGKFCAMKCCMSKSACPCLSKHAAENPGSDTQPQ